jgi:hypothetical protein
MTERETGEAPGPCPCSGCAHDVPNAKAGWPLHLGPLAVLVPKAEPGQQPRWVDHAYRIRRAGVWNYYAEPYDLGPDAFRDFVQLQEAGYYVIVSPSQARHFPGRTACVEIIGPESAMVSRG